MQIESLSLTETSPFQNAAGRVAWPIMVSRTVPVNGRSRRLRLESEVWDGLEEVSRREGRPVADLCRELEIGRHAGTTLATAVRVYVLNYFQRAAAL